MIELAAILMLTQAGLAPDARLDAFRAACVPHRQDLEATSAMMAADGWVQVPDDDHRELAVAMARARAETVVDPEEDPNLVMTATFSVWGRDFDGRRFHIILNRVDSVIGRTEDSDGDGEIQSWERAWGMTLLGCGLWDFDAETNIHPGLMTAWTAALPVAMVDQPGEIEGGVWNVSALLPGSSEVKISFVPENSPYEASLGVSGLAITLMSAPPETGVADEPSANLW